MVLIGIILGVYRFLSFFNTTRLQSYDDQIVKVSGSFKRLADYHAVVARSSNETAKSVNNLTESANKLISNDVPDTLAALRKEAQNTTSVANSAKAAVDTVNKVVGSDLAGLVQDVRSEVKSNSSEFSANLVSARKLTDEATRQLTQNGDSIKTFLNQGNALFATEGEIPQILAELKGTIHGVNVITNDPNLKPIIENMQKNTLNLAGITYNVELMTEDGAEITEAIKGKVIEKPPKNAADKYFWRPTVKILKVASGLGYLVYLFGR